METKFIGILVVVALVFGGGGYWAGSHKASQRGGQFFTQFGGQGNNRGARFMNGALAGEITAKDDTSITVRLGGPNASSTNSGTTGSKIVLVGASTEVGKEVAGSLQDLSVGQNVLVTGTPNSDGSLTAQMVQIRPANSNFGPQRGARTQ